MALIYKITCVPTGLVYVGQTSSTLQRRWYHHTGYARRGGSSKLCKAILEYGIHNFTIEAIEECGNGDEREAYWIAQFNSCVNGLNHTPTGRQGANKGTRRRPESNALQSIAMQGRTTHPEIKAKISAAMSGRSLSETHKSNLRKPKSPEAVANMRAAQQRRRKAEKRE